MNKNEKNKIFKTVCSSTNAIATTTFNMGFYFVIWRDTYISLPTLSSAKGLFVIYSVYLALNIILLAILSFNKNEILNCLFIVFNTVIIIWNITVFF